MAKRPLTHHQYSYLENGTWSAWINCSTSNSIMNEDGTIVIFGLPIINIPEEGVRVRVRALGLNPSGDILLSEDEFIAIKYEPVYDFYISDSLGNNANDGLTKLTPKKDFVGALPLIMSMGEDETPKVAFKAGDVFKAEVNIPFGGMTVGTYDKTDDILSAVVEGTIEVNTGWILKAGNVWELTVTNPPYSNPNGYDNIYVVEVTKDIKVAQPFSSRKYLKIAADEAEVESTPGSFRVTGYSNPYKIQLHPTNSVSPNLNPLYDFRITDTVYNIRVLAGQNTDVSNIVFRDASGGYGPLAMSGKIRRVVAQGGSTHIAVIGGEADLEYCAFLNSMLGGGQGSLGLVVYSAVIADNVNRLKNIRFFDNGKAFYSHASSGADAESLIVERFHCYGTYGKSDVFIEVVNHRNFSIDKSYCEGVGIAVTPCYGQNLVKNSVFKADNGIVYIQGVDKTTNLTVQNCLFVVKQNFCQSASTICNIQRNIIYVKDSIGSRVFPANSSTSVIVNHYNFNIVIIDAVGEAIFNSVWLHADGSGDGIFGSPKTVVANNNVYIKLSGTCFWQIRNNADGSTQNFNTWKTQSGLDQDSLYFDLSADPLKLKKIFVDPDNGNWTFTNSDEAIAIQAMGAGMTGLVTSYPVRPTYEQATDDALRGISLPNLM